MSRVRVPSLLSLSILLFGCLAGPPTGGEADISRQLSFSALIDPSSPTQDVFVFRWYECSQFRGSPFIYDECERAETSDWQVYGADVTLKVGIRQYVAEEVSLEDNTFIVMDTPCYRTIYHYDYNTYYRFRPDTLRPGDICEIEVTHSDFDTLRTSTILPAPIQFIVPLPDTLDPTTDSLRFAWSPAEHATGYYPVLYFATEGDSTARFELYEQFSGARKNSGPQENLTITYSINDVLQQIKEFFTGCGFSQVPAYYSYFYLVMKVMSLNEDIYDGEKPWSPLADNFFYFSAPLRAYVSDDNVGTHVGATWTIYSKEIVIPESLVKQLLEQQ